MGKKDDYKLELFSIACRKNKTKEITLANHIRRNLRNKPITTPNKYMYVAGIKRWKTGARKPLVLVLLRFSITCGI